jgi:hypothetical protein
MEKKCSVCSALFNCNAEQISQCFCYQYPALLSAEEGDCLCNNCLHVKIKTASQKIAASFTPIQAEEDNWVAKLPKSNQLLEDIDYYIENGFYVFTKWHHLKRGYCCGNGCRHCAYKP